MQYIAALARRKILAGAAIAFILGATLIVRTAAGVLIAGEAPPLADLEPLALDPAADLEPLALDPVADLEPLAPERPAQPAPAEMVVVYVSGAVAAPDVYRLPSGARVKDLVLAAGGLSADADHERINLAARVADGEHVHVPRVGDEAQPEQAAAESAGGAKGLININTAGPSELDSLPGIGPALAERIIAYREENGPFGAVEDLGQVKGIGSALLEQIAPLVTVGG